ncbi:hypothetical protein [Thermococcus aciditolerans]|uniref:Oligosaccharide repeat unit polymerase n=1 Tax=Thermococcus aciditolerans TaxID=2598455 RepID=A0A5C0SJP2_9EURY|nr:hypothetical protein [Thermococcus aciditolerans]QEK14643.1 hypothetical protein FPV09_05490 [Thermococcus aciditolerans]
MKRLPLLIPLLFIGFISLGLAEPKTMAMGVAFAVSIILGIYRGAEIGWDDLGLDIDERYIVWAFWISIAIIGLQILMLRSVPLLHPSVRTSLNPRLTALTYFLGVPSSVYLFLRGRRYALMYPIAVALYAYRTPVLVSVIALGAAYYEGMRGGGRIRLQHAAAAIVALIILGLGVTFLRGETLGSLWIRVQSSTSVLDIIVWRAGWNGLYHGYLQWSGIKSYLAGGYSPRGLVAKFLYVHTGVTITPTLLGGMYLDFGVFAVIEGFLLGVYYGMIGRAVHPVTMTLYYSTLAYGIVGVETGILDLPVYLLFGLGAYIIITGWRSAKREPGGIGS